MVIYLLVCDNSKCLLQTRIVNFTVKLNCVFVETPVIECNNDIYPSLWWNFVKVSLLKI